MSSLIIIIMILFIFDVSIAKLFTFILQLNKIHNISWKSNIISLIYKKQHS